MDESVPLSEARRASLAVRKRANRWRTIKETFEKYGQVKDVLPAMGYGQTQTDELEETINSIPCDAVLVGTPFDLGRLIKVDKPLVRVTYELDEAGTKGLEAALERF